MKTIRRILVVVLVAAVPLDGLAASCPPGMSTAVSLCPIPPSENPYPAQAIPARLAAAYRGIENQTSAVKVASGALVVIQAGWEAGLLDRTKWPWERQQRWGRRWMRGEMAVAGILALALAFGQLNPTITGHWVLYYGLAHLPFLAYTLKPWKIGSIARLGLTLLDLVTPAMLFAVYGAILQGGASSPAVWALLPLAWTAHEWFDRKPLQLGDRSLLVPIVGLSIVSVGLILPAVAVTDFFGGPKIIWLPRDLLGETVRMIGRLAFIEALMSAPVRSELFNNIHARVGAEKWVGRQVPWWIAGISVPGVFFALYQFHLSLGAPDGISAAANLVLVILSGWPSAVFIAIFLSSRLSAAWGRRFGTGLDILTTFPVLLLATLFSIRWSLFFPGVGASFVTALTLLAVAPAAAVYLITFTRYLWDSSAQKPGSREMARKAILIVRTLTLALVLILPWSLLHSWGHWLEYRSTLWPPEGLILYTGFSSEGFFPALETAKLSDLGALLHFSVNGAIRLYYAAGNIATWVYASALLFLSLFMKRLPKLRRGMTLAALAIGLLNLHYLTFTGFLYNPRATDWGHLWSLAPDSLITSFSRLVCILFPFLVLVYSTHLERTRENQDRQGAGHRDVVAAA